MKTLEELLLDDFALCFFGYQENLDSIHWRDWFIDTFMCAFPKGEVCIGVFDLTTSYNEISCNIIETNYIKD